MLRTGVNMCRSCGWVYPTKRWVTNYVRTWVTYYLDDGISKHIFLMADWVLCRIFRFLYGLLALRSCRSTHLALTTGLTECFSCTVSSRYLGISKIVWSDLLWYLAQVARDNEAIYIHLQMIQPTTHDIFHLLSASCMMQPTLSSKDDDRRMSCNGQQSDLQCFDERKTMQSDSLGRWT
jgi:hypothetical protein